MDKHEKRRLRSAAFMKHLRDELSGAPNSVAPVNPVAEFAPSLESPVGAYRAARDAKWAEGQRGIAGTGTPISELHGAAADSATRANLGDGPLAKGGRGQAGGDAALKNAGAKNAALAAAGWGALAVVEVARTMGPPMLLALDRANQDVRAAAAEDSGQSEAGPSD